MSVVRYRRKCPCSVLKLDITVFFFSKIISTSPHKHPLHYMCIAVFTLYAGLLAISQYSEGPATSHLDIGFSWFPCVYKQMLGWFPRFQVATTCFSRSPPDLNLLVTNFMFCVHVKQPLPPGDSPIAVNNNNKYYYYYHHHHLLYAGYLYSYSWDKLCP